MKIEIDTAKLREGIIKRIKSVGKRMSKILEEFGIEVK